MRFRQRLAIVSLLAGVSVLIYGVARYFAPALVAYVVERSLVEKAPPGTDTAELQRRFRSLMSEAPTRASRLQKAIRLSQHLEKVQRLTRPELDMLLKQVGETSADTISRDSWNFFAAENV